ncbi:inactive rhomboid protein 1-like [Ostrea edulis]|uniref:inactive rhomboid protein 1-like n=1 Tax=Ostrea edulis TaxID=37623 RepID=UPI0024AEFE42|nr:inactive rhomboid protein 1-like [Ostrea edulis]
MEEETGPISTQSSLKACLTSSARSILHFFGIHNRTDDDEVWEYKTLHRIQSEKFGLWRKGKSSDDATEILVQQVWTTMSNVLSEKVHILHGSAGQDQLIPPVSDCCLRNQRSTTSDWNQSAKNVKVVSDEASGSQQGAPPDSSADTESNVQDTSTNHQNIATSSQESPKSQSQTSTQGEEVTSDNKNQDVLSQQAAGPGHGESALQQDDKNQYVLSKQAAGPGHEESAVQEDNIPQQSGASFPNLGGKFENDEDREIYYSCDNVSLRGALDVAEEEVGTDEVKEQLPDNLAAADLAYGKEAYKNYSLYMQIERQDTIVKLKESKEAAMEKIAWKILKIGEVLDLAREYYLNPSSRAAKAWKDLQHNVRLNDSKCSEDNDEDMRHRLSTLHSHRPVFTILLVLVQVVVFIALCCIGGLTKMGFEPVLELSEGIPTFLGTETIHKWIKPNVWIGPDEKFWISVGAVYSTCIREDFKLILATVKKNYSSSAVLGCCEVANRNAAGTLTQQECEQETAGVGIWKIGVPCGSRPTGQNSVSHNIKPCCVNTRGECRMTSHQHCIFLEGVFHQEKGREHCSLVNCISEICIGKIGFMTSSIPSRPDRPWVAEPPKQWWRLPLSILYHHGIVHASLEVIVECLILSQIEITIGWLRLMILFVVCGCGGLLAAMTFNPYLPHVGATGAIFGAVGLLFVELIQFWSLINKPWQELLKLLFLMSVFIFSGTLPYLNIFSIIAGFVLGVLCAILLLPYISVKKCKAMCRVIMVSISIPFIVGLFTVFIYAFYEVQMLENCKFCDIINCYAYTKNMCKLLD